MSAKTFFKGRIISRHSVMLNQNVVPTREITRLCSKKKKKCDPQPGEKLFNGNIPPVPSCWRLVEKSCWCLAETNTIL